MCIHLFMEFRFFGDDHFYFIEHVHHFPLSTQASTVENTSLSGSQATAFFPYQPKKRLDRWHVCRDFQNGTCQKQESECEYAHPSPEKEIREGIVTICMDHVNEQCLRPNCKYLHPPKHICAQIHDHKKRPYPGFWPRALSSSESERTVSLHS